MLLHATFVTRCMGSYCKLLALYGVRDQIRVSLRFLSGITKLCLSYADLHGAMFAPNVACSKMLSAEWFFLSGASATTHILLSFLLSCTRKS